MIYIQTIQAGECAVKYIDQEKLIIFDKLYGMYVLHNSLYTGLYPGVYSLHGTYLLPPRPRLLDAYGFRFLAGPYTS